MNDEDLELERNNKERVGMSYYATIFAKKVNRILVRGGEKWD